MKIYDSGKGVLFMKPTTEEQCAQTFFIAPHEQSQLNAEPAAAWVSCTQNAAQENPYALDTTAFD